MNLYLFFYICHSNSAMKSNAEVFSALNKPISGCQLKQNCSLSKTPVLYAQSYFRNKIHGIWQSRVLKNILYTELNCMPTKFIKKLVNTHASAILGLWLRHEAGDQELVSSTPASAESQLGELTSCFSDLEGTCKLFYSFTHIHILYTYTYNYILTFLIRCSAETQGGHN